jgi:hypothetical protein
MGVVHETDEVGRVEQRPHPCWALREHLKRVPPGNRHDREHAGNELVRHRLVKQVALGVDEDPARLLPPQRLIEPVL